MTLRNVIIVIASLEHPPPSWVMNLMNGILLLMSNFKNILNLLIEKLFKIYSLFGSRLFKEVIRYFLITVKS